MKQTYWEITVLAHRGLNHSFRSDTAPEIWRHTPRVMIWVTNQFKTDLEGKYLALSSTTYSFEKENVKDVVVTQKEIDWDKLAEDYIQT